MALKGTLKDFGIADIFQLIGQQGKTGILHLADGDEQVHVHFKDGNVVKADCAGRKRKELLGDMLVRAGLISQRQLDEALEEQKRTLKRLGDILVSSRALARESLREMAQLQTTETLYRLFAWKSGTYEFEVTEVDFDPESITPIRSESVLMEGFRRVDEWPMIRKKISGSSMTFERLKELVDKPAGGDDLDDDLDAAFGEFEEKKDDEPDKSEGEFKNLGANERLVYKLAEPGRDVQFIIDRSRIGEFEVCKALLNLVNLGYLKTISGAGRVDDSLGRRRRWAARAVRLAGRAATGLLILGLGALVFTRLGSMAAAGGERRYADPAARRLVGRAQLSRIEAAIAVYRLEKGLCPESLEKLVEFGILSEGDLRYPWREQYHYRRTSDDAYVLLPPVE
ncbi:MAG TPA: hypothetical protein DFS52_20150 [Myxococcales bacterium]|jgi:hypothetical protein|nr:hypothetical protein [Myxococcales bacterium]